MSDIIIPGALLSATELMEMNKKNEHFQVVPKGDKLEDPTDEQLEEKKSGDHLKNLFELLKLERVTPSNSRSKGIYRWKEFRVEVTKTIGRWTGFGYTENKKTYMHPHEALLFMEMNRIEVTFDDVPMSIEQAYAIFLGSPNSLSWEEYIVYSYLVRAGYYVFLPDPDNDEEKYENSQLRNQSKIEDKMIWCVLNENLNLPFSFDFVTSNYNLYLKTKSAMKSHVNAICDDKCDGESSSYEPPPKKFKPFNEEQERNFLDILRAESEYLSYQQLFQKFNFIKRNEFQEPSDDEKALEFSFDVFYQKSNFKRTEDLVDYRLLVLSPRDKFPSNAQLEILRKSQPYQVPIIIAIVSQSIQFSICTF